MEIIKGLVANGQLSEFKKNLILLKADHWLLTAN